MSTCQAHPMTIHHGSGVLSQIGDRFRLWRKRSRERHELTRFSERDLHDVGLSWSEASYEAGKPFWQA